MKTIVHTCQQGTYACDYAQGEAVKVKRSYVPPVVDVLPVRVERGFQMSGCSTLFMGSEQMSDNGHCYFGSYDGVDEGNMEGIGSSGTIFF